MPALRSSAFCLPSFSFLLPPSSSLLSPLCLLAMVLLPAVPAVGEEWPGWRGPRGDGTSLDSEIPTTWDGATGKNILWKVKTPGDGHSSPVVWGERIFLTACLKKSKERILCCLDRHSGKTLWRRTVFRAPLETKHSLNSHASSTPATDGKLVYVSFLEVDGGTIPAPNVGNSRPVTPGRMVVAAYDFAGQQKWLVKPGGFVSAHGYCSNPVLFDDLVIVNGDHDGDSYIAAFKKASGKVVWKVPRKHKIRSYVTPIIRQVNGRTQMVLSGSQHVVSLDPRNGKRHWSLEGPTEQFVASMVYDGELFFLAAGFPTYHVMAIRPDGKGDVTDSHVAWHQKNARCYVPSPVLVGNYLMVADDRGTANCFDAATGKRFWQQRLGKHYSASLTAAAGLVYLMADDGVTKIVRPSPELEVVADNELGENCYASPAMAHGNLLVRGEKHVFCIQNKKVSTNASRTP